MMKKNRHFMLRAAILMVMAVFAFTAVNAQEEKEEKKVIKIKLMADKDGNVTMDTTIVLDEDFDGNWEDVIDDEDVLKKIKDIHVELDMDEDKDVYVVKSPHKTKKGYFYSVDAEDGNVKVEVKHGKDLEDIYVTTDGDTTMTFVVKTVGDAEDGEEKVMIWHSDGDHKHKKGDKEHKVMVYTTDGDEDMETIDVMIEELGGDSCKVMVFTKGDDDVKIVKKKEVIIITEDDDAKKDDKKKKKKK